MINEADRPLDSSSACLSYLQDSHWGWNKMAAVFQMTFSNAFSWISVYEFQSKISLKFVPKVPINYIPDLVQIMAWHPTGDKPLLEAMMA